jgi:esterase/lipase
MLPYWGNIKIPVMYIQGSKDKMIYTSNADFARENLINGLTSMFILSLAADTSSGARKSP